ncbi:MAG: 16S rRNA (uracil(1498)-N(3))-methyltransferase [Spirochaetales bacterium]|jgi:16S rRNA (uracil1498-N3)-methyltransferase|nr:16S rRNA (uracil(1498)-N(3))-methyltransferase [Spirochaetales bacterium]
MRVFVLPPSFHGEDFCELGEKDSHYLCRVRRLKAGDSLPAQDGAGNEYHATIEKADPACCLLRVQKKGASPARGEETELALYQCLPKGAKFDLIVRQAVELGVSRIVPVRSRYSVQPFSPGRYAARKSAGEFSARNAQEEAGKPEGRRGRWSRIAREAVQQSGARTLPEIAAPLSFAEIPGDVQNWGADAAFFFHQQPLETRTLHEYLFSCPQKLALVIGPEGGLADEETRLLRQAAFEPVYLGHRVLRTETAPVFAVAAIRIILLEKEWWKLSDGNTNTDTNSPSF